MPKRKQPEPKFIPIIRIDCEDDGVKSRSSYLCTANHAREQLGLSDEWVAAQGVPT